MLVMNNWQEFVEAEGGYVGDKFVIDTFSLDEL
jgi:hypothetical protein